MPDYFPVRGGGITLAFLLLVSVGLCSLCKVALRGSPFLSATF